MAQAQKRSVLRVLLILFAPVNSRRPDRAQKAPAMTAGVQGSARGN